MCHLTFVIAGLWTGFEYFMKYLWQKGVWDSQEQDTYNMWNISDNYHKGEISIISHHFPLKKYRFNWWQADISSILRLQFFRTDLHRFLHFFLQD